ncbi:GAF and ANTAR domain-containing protein [Cellulosimicrobium sp. PMB13]|uniref:GAF and ANTAR domain-containing protein n=1 Tax=Cellulosimicrobium sp. PMB13 TaxID=3120158 RepID=UPI003F4C70AD
MTDRTAAHALASTTSALVGGLNVTDFLARMLGDVVELFDVDSAAVLVALPDGALDVLSATSHEATALEVYQAQRHEGPCVDAIRGDGVVSASSADEVARRWPDVGTRMLATGYRSVCATPMHWQGAAFAGINVFASAERALTTADLATLRTFADLATLAIVSPDQLDGGALAARVARALDERVVVEQAKGVIAYRDEVDTAEAYRRLLALASAAGRPLDEVAAELVTAAARGR